MYKRQERNLMVGEILLRNNQIKNEGLAAAKLLAAISD